MNFENTDKIKKILVLKNDAVGDLCQSLPAIQNIIDIKNSKVEICLSERSQNFKFLINGDNINFKILNYNLTLKEKFLIFFKCLIEKIDRVYILTPKNFYFYLPLFFRNIKFYAICLNGRHNYLRPNNFLRKFLYKYEINDRSIKYKRISTENIQKKLTCEETNSIYQVSEDLNVSSFLKENLPANYVYFHLKKKTIDKLDWSADDLNYLFNHLLKYYDNVVFTRDIENNKKQIDFSEQYNVVNFKSKIFNKKDNNIFLFDEIEGLDLFNTIKFSSKIIAFHGMMTNLGSLLKKKITDLWFFDTNNLNDYMNYRNAFYEFKPIYTGYDFLIPSKDIKKTFRKLVFSIK
jgi:hypothetical protein